MQNCDITLTFHRGDGKLLCHYCNYREKAPRVCPHCPRANFYILSAEGTENITEQLVKKFPSMRIARVDRDTMWHTKAKWRPFCSNSRPADSICSSAPR
ncbi:MAG: hypothetical protein IPJ55_07520 [Chloracidobacterium sp.]|nr:hypothetical protein [Chloracidobacterium sp.]